MGKAFATLTVFIGSLLALTSTSACIWFILDEVDTPDSLIR